VVVIVLARKYYMRILEVVETIPFPFLYHATRESNVASIKKYGLLSRYYGVVHGEMDMHPPKPAIYLSRARKSNNLHSDLFNEPVIVLKIDTRFLDHNELWPDDFIYDLWANEDILTTPRDISRALGITPDEANALKVQLDHATDEQIPMLLKPFWRWYLVWRRVEKSHTRPTYQQRQLFRFRPIGNNGGITQR
jgi:hypothetical protein